jgi:hypothetical protein
MKPIVVIYAFLAVAVSSGCSTRNIYDGIRFHQELDCSQLRGADRDDCFRRSGMSYDEYQRQLKERQGGTQLENK